MAGLNNFRTSHFVDMLCNLCGLLRRKAPHGLTSRLSPRYKVDPKLAQPIRHIAGRARHVAEQLSPNLRILGVYSLLGQPDRFSVLLLRLQHLLNNS